MICSFNKLIYPKSLAEAESGSYMIGLYNLHEKISDLQGNRVTEAKVVGYYLPTTPKIQYDMTGHWTKNAKHGTQYELEHYREIIKPTRDGIIAYLSSGLIKGIGSKIAERIYDAFGDNTLEVLDNQPEELLHVQGISKAKLQKILDSYVASRGARDVVTLLAPHGVSANRAVKIYKEFGSEAVSIIREHPYRLSEMSGIGFLTADSIARSMGLNPLSSERIGAGLLYALQDAEAQGHLCLPKQNFIAQGINLLNTSGITEKLISQEAYQLLQDKRIVLYGDQVYRHLTARAEQDTADLIRKLLTMGEIKYSANLDSEINLQQETLGITLAPEQRQAVKSCLTSHICIVSGGPGTGKTMIQEVLLNIYIKAHPKAKIICCAPTGRAARRMEECTGQPASTIHRALGLMGGDDEFSEVEPFDADFVLVDEVSMLDIYLARHLLGAVPKGCQLILIGDADQLPSVGPGAVLSEMIACGRIPVVKLDKVFRQDAGSRVATNAKRIRHNEVRLEYGDDFQFHASDDLLVSAEVLERFYLDEVDRVGIDNVALLTPYRKKTETGVNALNDRLREKLNPRAPGKPEVTYGKRLFRQGDKVMQIKNKDEISNGDIGYITRITTLDGDTTVLVDFGDGRCAEYDSSELELLDLAYATTVHKSQGSEYQVVLINLQNVHFIMLKRPLIYTAVTRARQKAIIVGQQQALFTAIRKVDAEKRGTMLANRINE